MTVCKYMLSFVIMVPPADWTKLPIFLRSRYWHLCSRAGGYSAFSYNCPTEI